MSQQQIEDTKLYTIEWNEDLECVEYTWNEYASGERFREGGRALLEAVESRRASNVIVDTSGIEAHDDDDQDWIQNELTPQMIDAGAENVVTVHGDSVIAEMDMEEIYEELDKLSHNAHMAGSVEEARDWIADQ